MPEQPTTIENRRSVSRPRPKRVDQREAAVAADDESLWQRFDWRELNLASTARTLRHWHD